MVKHTQTIRREFPTNCLSVFDHFVILALKGLRFDFTLIIYKLFLMVTPQFQPRALSPYVALILPIVFHFLIS